MTHYLKYVFVITTLAGANTAYAQAKTQEHYQELEVGVGGNIKHTNTDINYKNKKFDLHIHPLWESRYVTEGRDNFAGNGTASIATEFNYKNFAVIPWAAKGISSDYSELNLNAIYKTTANPSVLLDNPTANSKIDVDVYVDLKEQLIQPELKFRIEFPNVSSTLKSELEYKLQNEEQKQTQALFLLASNSFVNDNYGGTNAFAGTLADCITITE